MEDRWRIGRYFNFFIFVFLLIGIILGKTVSSYLFFVSLFLVASFFVYFFIQKKKSFLSDLSLFVLFVCLGALLFISFGSARPDNFLEGRPKFTIKVTSLPDEGANRNTFFAEVLKVEGQGQNFRVRVYDYSQEMTYLNRYRLKANLSKRIYQGRGYYNLWVRKATRIQQLPLNFWEKLIKKANYYCLDVFEQNCSLAAKNFLAAIFLGRRELMGKQQEFMQNAGLAHLLAISGLHIGLISLILFYFLRFFNLSFRASLLLSCVFLIFYAAATGLRASIQRAVVMYLIFAFSFLLKRKIDVLNSLGFAGVVLLLVRPALAYDVGFQLSFVAVLGIIVGFKIFSCRQSKLFLLNYAKQVFFCSFFVFLFILPLTAYYFGRIHPLSIFYNIILIPLFALILFLNLILVIISPFTFLAQSLGAVLSWIIYLFQNLTRFLGSLPVAYFSYSFSLQELFIYYFILFLVLFSAFKLKNKKLYNLSKLSSS